MAHKIYPGWLGMLATVLLVGATLIFPLPSSGDDISPAPQVTLNPGGISPSRECGKCHKDIYAAWENSLHAQGTDNLVFWTAYLQAYFKNREYAQKSCLACHAPLAFINRDFDLVQPLTHEGINCDYCHTISEVSFEKPYYRYTHQFGLIKQGPLNNVESPVHQTRFNPLYKNSLYCAGCHELESPNGVKLIETFSEWQQSPYPKKNIHCQDCHMKQTSGKVVAPEVLKVPGDKVSGHDIAGGHSISMREISLDLEIKDVSIHKNKVEVVVRVTNRGAGHKIPTGLPTKRFVLEVAVVSKDGKNIQTRRKSYQKLIVNHENHPVTNDVDLLMGDDLKLVSDNRIGAGETREERFTFFVSEENRERVTAVVYYAYNPKILMPAPIHIKIKESVERLGK